ncbi:MAG: hypothetical protein KKC19_04140 [Nanoarchaeota archaeon]|nr:hypothetical protein [Nanoarchaeota archaeon]
MEFIELKKERLEEIKKDLREIKEESERREGRRMSRTQEVETRSDLRLLIENQDVLSVKYSDGLREYFLFMGCSDDGGLRLMGSGIDSKGRAGRKVEIPKELYEVNNEVRLIDSEYIFKNQRFFTLDKSSENEFKLLEEAGLS